MKLTAVVVGIFIRSRRLSLFDIAKMNVVICVSVWKSNLCRNYADSETGKLIFWKRTECYLRSKIERFRNLPKNKKRLRQKSRLGARLFWAFGTVMIQFSERTFPYTKRVG